MTDGVIILDVSDENNITFKSHLQLDLNFPAPQQMLTTQGDLNIKMTRYMYVLTEVVCVLLMLQTKLTQLKYINT